MITPCCQGSMSKAEWTECALNEPYDNGGAAAQLDQPSCSICGEPISDAEVAKVESKTGKKAYRS